ncbi:hypothetical protein ACHQM5_006371 [Ranunculus cassubicifolius]
MAYKATTLLKNEMGSLVQRLSCRRWSHIGITAPLSNGITRGIENSFVLPEIDQGFGSESRVEMPSFSFGGGMELMAVPKKKISKHKRGIRNGPKALKPIPVIVRCTCCGRVKLPHFYCCSGKRGTEGERADSTN